MNTFFWFVEARQSPESAPLTIWLNGGPGTSSLVGLFQENGPCEVMEIAKGQFGTRARDWGWDRSSNILYIDEPNEVGFSYDTPSNGSLDLLGGAISEPPTPVPTSQPADTFLNGTFSSNNGSATANTTQLSAQAIWHMLQGFLAAFPQYNPGTRPGTNLTGAVGVNLFTESYGGKYGPAFASFWEQQNRLRQNGSIPSNSTLEVELRSLGIMSGCVDDLIQGPFYPIMASNNTYGIQAISTDVALTAAESFQNQGGCQQAIQQCRSAAASSDPGEKGYNTTVDSLCSSALTNCNQNVVGPYLASGRSVYDITHRTPDPFPPSTYIEYLNTADFLEAIGTPINYTQTSSVVQNAFISTGDWERGNQISELSSLLSMNIRVALIYGDRDYVCNWMGGEAVSFALAGSLSAMYSPFYAAGYADIIVNSSYVGGQVRQYGNLSFARIYDAGHLIPASQPETAFTVFTRVITGVDVATGEPVDLGSFGSKGGANSTYTNSAPPAPSPTCWVRNVANSCTDQQKQMLQQGKGVIINGVLYNQESDWQAPGPSLTSQVGMPGVLPTTTIASGTGGSSASSVATGVYVATGPPPKSTKKGAAARAEFRRLFLFGLTGLALALEGLL